ncbi:DMT family transporter [Effusibacillus pohliae]|uniref:DMT family transporter n=1 Tax=Effusibacillus pohliae TaxID=232270 RepID=UPI00036B8FF1|nr:DMT family transporter [Effusibacillus pohliae]
MQSWAFVGLMIVAGVMIGFQSPINATLSRKVGIFESAFVSFSVGTLTLLMVVALLGKGNLREAAHAPVWQFLGGVLGAIYVTAIIVGVPQIGVTTVMVAVLAGQLATGLLIDQFGWFGVQQRPIDWQRAAGVALLFVSIWLIYGKK